MISPAKQNDCSTYFHRKNLGLLKILFVGDGLKMLSFFSIPATNWSQQTWLAIQFWIPWSTPDGCHRRHPQRWSVESSSSSMKGSLSITSFLLHHLCLWYSDIHQTTHLKSRWRDFVLRVFLRYNLHVKEVLKNKSLGYKRMDSSIWIPRQIPNVNP